MPYEHRTANCFSDAIGKSGLSRRTYLAELRKTEPVLETLRDWHRDGTLPLLRLPAACEDIDALVPLAGRFRDEFDDVIVLGTGGSSLGGQTLCALADRGFGPPRGTPRLHFMDNVDPDSFAALFTAVAPARTGLIVISKSGGTAETLAQLAACVGALEDDAAPLAGRCVALTEPRDNPLRRLAGGLGFQLLDHDPGIGGRFSALSNVGLLPSMIAGLDAAAVRDGAAEILDPVLAGAAAEDIPAATGAAISVALFRTRSIAQTVLMPYADRLAPFGLWYRQLWAESLGKDGLGTTPIRAMGTVDQHSQLQLYLDGPADKMFTVLGVDSAGDGPAMTAEFAGEAPYLSGRTMGDLLDAECRATADTLAARGRPTRTMQLARLDARAMGALMMHFMLETMIAAGLLGVDAFDQPAVEDGKVLTRRYLTEMGALP